MNGVRAVLCMLVLAAFPTGEGLAQSLPRPERAWQSISTAHFDILYPKEMSEWTEPVAKRMESVAAAVNAMVGNSPRKRVTVLVEDPSNVANGFALPFLEGPIVFLWPTPPTPGPTFGAHRGWGEILAVHEYGHIAHLTYPSRNSFNNFVWRFLPVKIGPVARKSPAWVIEGYATYIEGKLTGSGRPNSVGRAAIFRTWALDGKLPTYEQLNSARPFLGGSMRYLVGSAFLEWLAARKGDESLTNLWRRMSARQSRSFAEAFRGAFGAYPDELYGRFYVEVMAQSLEIERQIQAEGTAAGELLQHYRWSVGGPAVSPDGGLVALSVGARGRPARLEVWSTIEEGVDSALIRGQRQMIERDSMDVAAVDSFPARRKVIATLRASAGRSAESPRFFADNERLLIVRNEPLGDGAERPDLFIWSYKTGRLKRVTHGAAIRSADPSPDGRSAVGSQCLNGICSLVIADLASGQIRTLVRGTPDVVWYRPRFSPDGQTIVASVHRDGRWQVALVTVATGATQELTPADDSDRYAPSFAADGRQLIAVSERGGIANLEIIDIASLATRTLTRVIGAVSAPDVSMHDGNVYFLTLHSRGYDVRRLNLTNMTAVLPEALSAQLYPAAPHAPYARPPFADGAIDGPHDYSIGPRHWRVLPGGTVGPEGSLATLSFANTDPVGRVGILATGGYGERSAWRGGSLAIETRRTPVHIGLAGWYTARRPGEQATRLDAASVLDGRYAGGGATLSMERQYARWGTSLRAGASQGFLDGGQFNRDGRAVGVAEVRGRLTLGMGGSALTVSGSTTGARGVTADSRWSLGIARGALTLGGARGFVRVEGLSGEVTAAESGQLGRRYEQFAVGGSAGPFADVEFRPNHISLPGVPVGFAGGNQVGMARAVLGGQLLEPSITVVAAGDRRAHWKRVFALERELSFPSLGYARLPAVHVRGGVSYSVDAPYDGKVRTYFSLTYRP